MNYETIKEAAFYGNTRVAGNLGITLPEDLTKMQLSCSLRLPSKALSLLSGGTS